MFTLCILKNYNIRKNCSAEGGGGRGQVAGARPRILTEGQQKAPQVSGAKFT